MLNFREELGKIKKEKFDSEPIRKDEAEEFLKEVLNYFKNKKAYQLLHKYSLCFRSVENRVLVEDLDLPIHQEPFDSMETAMHVLRAIAIQLQEEGYQVSPDEALRKSCFYLEILP